MSGPHVLPPALAPFFASVSEQSRERTQDLARQRAATIAPTEWLSFAVAQEDFALPLSMVQEICLLDAVTAVPRTRPQTLGIMSLRGEVVPVVDLAAILGFGHSRPEDRPKNSDRAARGVLLSDGLGFLALHVRSVQGVVRLLPQDVVPRPFGLAAQHPELITALGRTARGTVTLLDGGALLRHLERLT